MAEAHIYPHLSLENNKKPNRIYAFPLSGLVIKLILLIPVLIEVSVLVSVAIIALVINWFFILFTGKYWDSAYKLFLGLLRLGVKIILFILGITDKYPGFTLDTDKLFEMNIAKPEKPNIWLAIPVLGTLARVILLIPYLIFTKVMIFGSIIAMIISWFAVTFKEKFPESIYEFEKDSLRVCLATSSYLLGLSDKYPSFAISMNHQTAKVLLLVVGALIAGSGWDDKDRLGDRPFEYSLESENDFSPPSDFEMKYEPY